jgi:glutathione peroxidase-family protein
MFEKVDVNGKNAHPVWVFMKSRQGGLLGMFGMHVGILVILQLGTGDPNNIQLLRDSITRFF